MLVPQRAVSELQGNYQVAVLTSSNTIYIQPVRVGERSSNSWIIEEGLHSGQRVVVEGVQMIKRHTRPNPQRNIKGGIVEKEAPIHISNVAIVCKNCKQHARIANKVLADGRRVRACKKCGNTIE